MKKDSILLIKISSRKKVKNLGEPVTICPAGSEYKKKKKKKDE